MRERDIVIKIEKALKDIGGFFFKVHGGMYQIKGIPDILYWSNGKSYAFEVKLPSEKHPVSKLQDKRLRQLKNEGVIVGVVHSVEEVETIITTGKSNYPRDI